MKFIINRVDNDHKTILISHGPMSPELESTKFVIINANKYPIEKIKTVKKNSATYVIFIFLDGIFGNIRYGDTAEFV